MNLLAKKFKDAVNLMSIENIRIRKGEEPKEKLDAVRNNYLKLKKMTTNELNIEIKKERIFNYITNVIKVLRKDSQFSRDQELGKNSFYTYILGCLSKIIFEDDRTVSLSAYLLTNIEENRVDYKKEYLDLLDEILIKFSNSKNLYELIETHNLFVERTKNEFIDILKD